VVFGFFRFTGAELITELGSSVSGGREKNRDLYENAAALLRYGDSSGRWPNNQANNYLLNIP
jgi:hypothetical protein